MAPARQHATADVLARIQSVVKALSNNGAGDLQTRFGKHDKANAGALSLHELQDAMRKELHLPAGEVSDSEISALFNYLDPGRRYGEGPGWAPRSAKVPIDALVSLILQRRAVSGFHAPAKQRTRWPRAATWAAGPEE